MKQVVNCNNLNWILDDFELVKCLPGGYLLRKCTKVHPQFFTLFLAKGASYFTICLLLPCGFKWQLDIFNSGRQSGPVGFPKETEIGSLSLLFFILVLWHFSTKCVISE